MAFTITTVENETTIVFTSTTVATTIFAPSPAEIGRYRFRVARAVYQGATGGDSVTVTAVSPTASGTETQTIFLTVCPQGAGPAAVVIAASDTVSFPDECEWRGKIQVANTMASGTITLFLYHG